MSQRPRGPAGGAENAGHENEGPNWTAGKCRTYLSITI